MAKIIADKDKKKAWDAFSHFIRIRDCLRTTGTTFHAICITCGRRHHWDYLDAGHCFAGRTNVKLLNEKFVHAQCKYCNQVCNGKLKKYRGIMEDKYGIDFVDRQYARFKRIVIHNRDINWTGRVARYKRKEERELRRHGHRTLVERLTT